MMPGHSRSIADTGDSNICIATLTLNNSNSHDNVYSAVIVEVDCHCESSPGSFDEYSTSAGRPQTFGPSQSA